MSQAGHPLSRPSLPSAPPVPWSTAQVGGSAAVEPRRTVELAEDESLRLLGGATLGRVVFTQSALPAIRPVNHLLDRGRIVIRTHQDSDLFIQARHHGDQGVVVAYQADDIDPLTHLGWSVVATGYCRPVTDPDDLMCYQQLIRPWSDRVMNCAVQIRPHLVTGIMLTP